MQAHASAYAYLVKAYFLTASGTLFSEPDTICFDLDLALEIAEEERGYAAGLAVYALDAHGDLLADLPLVSHGEMIPACRTGALS